MAALMLGIVAAICTGLSYIPSVSFLSYVGLILAIVAWVVGRKMTKANPSDAKAKIGMIIGIIITVLAIISVIMAIVLIAGAAALVMG